MIDPNAVKRDWQQLEQSYKATLHELDSTWRQWYRAPSPDVAAALDTQAQEIAGRARILAGRAELARLAAERLNDGDSE